MTHQIRSLSISRDFLQVDQTGERRQSLPDSFHIERVAFFSTFALSPFQNMGIDEWIATEAPKHPGQLFARLYCWSPGGISIGYHQDIDRALLGNEIGNTPVIRRMTGGRAVYHDPSELTYSFAWCAPVDVSFRREFDSTIRQILEAFLLNIGTPTHPAPTSDPDDRSSLRTMKSPCFASRSKDELIGSQGQKIVARAKREVGRLQFEHGSVKLSGVAGHPALPGWAVGVTLPEQQAETFRRAAIFFEQAIRSQLADNHASPLSVLLPHEIPLKAAVHIRTVESAPLSRRIQSVS